ncbi:recombinase family protein [Streptomyces althioticus]|uniref:recombinase family protein n=1 Tax=Streptomyces althioticus TaxID=83380 RepID=UPI0033F8B1FF
MYDPSGPGRLLFAFFAAMAETERENIRESTLEGLDAAAREGKHGGRPPVITDDMLHTVLRRRTNGDSVEQIQPDLIIPTGKRKRQTPSVASIYRALAEHEKRQAYPEAVEQETDPERRKHLPRARRAREATGVPRGRRASARRLRQLPAARPRPHETTQRYMTGRGSYTRTRPTSGAPDDEGAPVGWRA